MLKLWKLAWPVMILGGTRVAMRTADIIIVGFLGSWAAASVGLGDVWLRVILFFGIGLGAGTVARVSQGLGAGRNKQADAAMTQAILIVFIFGLLTTAIFWFFSHHLIILLGGDDVLVKHAGGYLQIVGLSAIPRLIYLVCFRGMTGSQDSITPAIIGSITTLINIFATLVLVFGLFGLPALDVAGAAWGTFIGNTLAGLSCFWLLAFSNYRLNFNFSDLKKVNESLKIIRIGIPRVLNGSVDAIGNLPLNAILLWFGTEAVAAYQIAFRVQMLAMMPNWGIAEAAGAYSGYHLGGDDPHQAAAQGWEAVKLSLLVSGPVALGLVLLRHPIAFLFIREQPTLQIASEFITVGGLVILCFCIYHSLEGALEGAGHTAVPMLSAVAGKGTLLILAALLGGWMGMGLRAIYAAFLIGYLLRLLLVWAWYEYYRWGEHPALS